MREGEKKKKNGLGKKQREIGRYSVNGHSNKEHNKGQNGWSQRVYHSEFPLYLSTADTE